MDLQENQNQVATSSSTAQPESPSADSKTLRSSARVKAAKLKEKDKGKGKEREQLAVDSSSASSSSILPTRSSNKTKRPREQAKGKGKETQQEPTNLRASKRARRATNPPAAPLSIQEPVRDPKGKKRAAPENPSDEEEQPSASAKRPRTTSYSLRSQQTEPTPSDTATDMTRKTRSSVTNGKGKMPAKVKAAAAGSSRLDEDPDVEMADGEYHNNPVSDEEQEQEESGDHEDSHSDNDNDPDNDEDNDGMPPSAGMDESAAMAMFGDYRQFGSYMMSLSTRLKTMLTNIKTTADPTTRLVTLQELSELLSISTEDTLAGSFQVEQFVRELVKILGGRGADEDDDDDEGAPEQDQEQDEDAALAAALAMSTGGAAFQGDDNLEAQVLACRCLANLMEALPGVAHTVVYHGAIPVLCSKLIEISYIDLAEQTLSTMEKISEEFPSAIVREGGLAALLNYLDFFSIAVQRTALQAASNCCRNVSVEYFPMIRGVWAIIRNCLAYSDQRLVEFACSCVIRVIDSYHRASVENLESLVDKELITAILMLLLPAGGSPLISSNTFMLLLRALATSAKASPKITLVLLEADVVGMLYQILTGVLPPSNPSEEQGGSATGQGMGGGLADMTVMENLAHRPKDQIEEALSLISELMPPLPKDGVFDHKGYTEKSLLRMAKAKAKAERAASRLATQNALASAFLISPAPPAPALAPAAEAPTVANSPAPPAETEGQEASSSRSKDTTAADRTELLRSNDAAVSRFMQLMVPVLIDVYAASVITPVRVKSLTGLLKAVSFLEADGLKSVLTYVPVGSFASSILSSKDNPSLVIGALQLVDLLLTKVPTQYKPTFRREGVFHEIESLAGRDIAVKKDAADSTSGPGDSASPPPAPLPSSAAMIPGFKKLTSLSLDPDDAITLRARVIKFKYLTGEDQAEGDNAFDTIRRLVKRLSEPKGSEKELTESMKALADLFASPNTSVSSFELLQSGVVDGLLQFATNENRKVSVKKRKEILLDVFASRRTKVITGQTPFATLVKKLQESLTRMESFDVITVAQGIDDSKRSSPSLLARQLRLRLVAGDDSDIPRSLHNIVVSIHAIATFQALHDYLRPRVSGILSGGSSSRLSGMLAALAASGYTGTPRGFAEEFQRTAGKAPASTPATAASASAGPSTSSRRRSLRLAKAAGEDADAAEAEAQPEPEAELLIEAPVPTLPTEAQSSSAMAEGSASAAAREALLEADFTDDEVDAEVFDEQGDDPDNSIADKTVTLSVEEDGSKVVAQTPDGTRVATPSGSSAPNAPTPRQSLSAKASYASALKAKPSDWHLEFSMDDQPLPLDLTIYGAIHQHEMRKKTGGLPASQTWQGVYTVKFKKMSGPLPANEAREGPEGSSKNRSPSPSLSSLPEDAPSAKILRLLRVLHNLNTLESERAVFLTEKRNLPESAFVNNKLTAKLTRQLEEPMIVASSCLPDWALDLPQHFPFLFPFATRYNFLQSTSFGYARLILKWQSQQSRVQDSSRRDDGIGFLGRLQRQKVRISRKHILESAVKVFELYGSSSSVLEVEYFEEVGTGLGPTLEFYSLVSKEFARKDLKIWRDADSTRPGAYVYHPAGLYPAPISHEDIASDGGQKRTHLFRVIGQYIAKAMLDSRIIDLSINKIFIKLILGEEVPVTIATLKLVDAELASSLLQIQGFVNAKNKLSQKALGTVEDMELDFSLPGYEIELRPGGRSIPVTSANVEEYINEVLGAIIGQGAQLQAQAFRDGFSKVFPISDLNAFSADELVMLFGNADEDWSPETLGESLKADHGFNVESRAIRDLVEIMSEYDTTTRRACLQFMTGSPKLPIGGFRGLNPPLTVVRKPHEAPLTADDYLPSVMTCVNYLKLPEYSSKLIMREKMRVAIQEGVGSFHLS